MPPSPQRSIMPLTVLIALHADPGPVIDCLSQPLMARVPHGHDSTLATLLGHRRRAGQGPHRVILSSGEGLRGFAEQRGGDESPDARQGPEDLDVTVLGAWSLGPLL